MILLAINFGRFVAELAIELIMVGLLQNSLLNLIKYVVSPTYLV